MKGRRHQFEGMTVLTAVSFESASLTVTSISEDMAVCEEGGLQYLRISIASDIVFIEKEENHT